MTLTVSLAILGEFHAFMSLGYFANLRKFLKEDCPLIGCIPGNDTLYELRTSLQIAQQEIENGISPHISPTLQTKDMSNVLNKAGFHLITSIFHPSRILKLINFVIRSWYGWSDCWISVDERFDDGYKSHGRKQLPHISVRCNLSEFYTYLLQGNRTCEEMSSRGPQKFIKVQITIQTTLDLTVCCVEYYGRDGKIPATFSLIYFIGWSPSAKQPKAKERGEFETNLKTIL